MSYNHNLKTYLKQIKNNINRVYLYLYKKGIEDGL